MRILWSVLALALFGCPCGGTREDAPTKATKLADSGSKQPIVVRVACYSDGDLIHHGKAIRGTYDLGNNFMHWDQPNGERASVSKLATCVFQGGI